MSTTLCLLFGRNISAHPACQRACSPVAPSRPTSGGLQQTPGLLDNNAQTLHYRLHTYVGPSIPQLRDDHMLDANQQQVGQVPGIIRHSPTKAPVAWSPCCRNTSLLRSPTKVGWMSGYLSTLVSRRVFAVVQTRTSVPMWACLGLGGRRGWAADDPFELIVSVGGCH